MVCSQLRAFLVFTLILKVVPFSIPRVTCSMEILGVLVLYSGSMGEPSYASLEDMLISYFSVADVAIMASTSSSLFELSFHLSVLGLLLWHCVSSCKPSLAQYYWHSQQDFAGFTSSAQSNSSHFALCFLWCGGPHYLWWLLSLGHHYSGWFLETVCCFAIGISC